MKKNSGILGTIIVVIIVLLFIFYGNNVTSYLGNLSEKLFSEKLLCIPNWQRDYNTKKQKFSSLDNIQYEHDLIISVNDEELVIHTHNGGAKYTNAPTRSNNGGDFSVMVFVDELTDSQPFYKYTKYTFHRNSKRLYKEKKLSFWYEDRGMDVNTTSYRCSQF